MLAVTLIGAGAFLGACGGDDEAAAPPPPPPPGGNNAPVISGSPAGQIMQGQAYSFTPTASDADSGDVLTFSIANRPAWAAFTASNGRLSGTPSSADVGPYSGIVISVTDGKATTNLAAFDVQVVATALGSVTLNWTSPTQNTDGTPLTNLSGFKVYWGTSQGSYPNSVTLSNPGLTTYIVEQLTPATWYFTMTALNSSGAESALSNPASKTVQ